MLLAEAVRIYVEEVAACAEALPADDEEFTNEHLAVVSALGYLGSLDPGCDDESRLAEALAKLRSTCGPESVKPLDRAGDA